MDARHPQAALFADEADVPQVSPCDHVAGTDKTMRRSLALQAEQHGRFDVTLDLEDGAPTGGEAEHAELVAALLAGPENVCRRAGARIHGHESPWWQSEIDTLIAAAGDRLAHLTIPKASQARQVADMITYLQQACAVAGLSREIPIHVLIETHGGLADAERIASLPWMRGLDFGLMDFVSGHDGAIPIDAIASPGQFEHALVRRAKADVAAAALAHGLVPSHNVTIALDDPDQVAADAARARAEFGYLRMWSIHPSQIEPILAAFAPRPDEVAEAATILLAGRAASWAPIRHAGRLHDRASFRYHWRVLLRAREAGRSLSPEAEACFFAEPGPA